MLRRTALTAMVAGLAGLVLGCRQAPAAVLSEAEALALYDTPLQPPSAPQKVFHLGHSLVGQDMPAMLAQLAGQGHASHYQIGWGTSLRDHWDDRINGRVNAGDHPAAGRAPDALDGGGYDAVIFTEMVEIRDAIRYHHSADYLHRWVKRARNANTEVRLYFYESWPRIDDAEGWLDRIEKDLTRHWEQEILFPAVRSSGLAVHVIPGGQALAATVRAVMAAGGVDGVSRIEDFFAKGADGTQDVIHLNDLGSYVIALTHYAVLYHASPVGLSHALRRSDGSAAVAPSQALAQLIQRTVWDSVANYPMTGIHRQV